jgi:hypothetical protein
LAVLGGEFGGLEGGFGFFEAGLSGFGVILSDFEKIFSDFGVIRFFLGFWFWSDFGVILERFLSGG